MLARQTRVREGRDDFPRAGQGSPLIRQRNSGLNCLWSEESGNSLGLLGNVGWWDRAPPAGYLREYAPAAPNVNLPGEATVGLWGGGKQDGVTGDPKTSQPGLRDQYKVSSRSQE